MNQNNELNNIAQDKYVLAFKDGKILIKTFKERLSLPLLEDLKFELISFYIIHSSSEEKYYLVKNENYKNLSSIYKYHDVRSLFNLIDEDQFRIIGRAAQINYWDNLNNYCGKCGTANITNYERISKECPACKSVVYPLTNPAIIVAITKGDKILLAKNINFKQDFYSVLAGFVEPGETLEECVKREVREEVNIEIKNIKYFDSQSWPYPDSIMIGFTAEYASGKIKVAPDELIFADWFSAHNLPLIPSPISISRKLIDWFVKEFS